MALYHILSVFRQMTWTTLAARSGNAREWQEAHAEIPAQSHNPRDHTLGIIGLGNIGLAIANKVRKALEMKIIYTDVSRKSARQEDEVDAIYFESLDSLLSRSDCVLIATPAGPPLLTARTLALLPHGARVVNIARGSLVDENALADALESGRVSAAGLDVHMKEPYVSPRLSARRDVSLTCHTGGGSLETIKGFEKLVLENVLRVLNGEEPLTCVNKYCLRQRGNINGAQGNGHGNGHINGHMNGRVNGHANGHANGDNVTNKHINGENAAVNNANGSC